MKRAFDMIDEDGSGQIDAEELQGWVLKTGHGCFRVLVLVLVESSKQHAPVQNA